MDPPPILLRPTDFDGFARAELPRLLAYATALTGDPHVAADVVQEAMVRAHQHWSRVQGADRPDLYVRRMITNEFLSWRRRWHVRTIVSVPDEALRPRAAEVTDHTEILATREALWNRLFQLPRRQRAAVVLRYYEDLDDDEIAELMRISPSTVRSSISRALAALRIDSAEEGILP